MEAECRIKAFLLCLHCRRKTGRLRTWCSKTMTIPKGRIEQTSGERRKGGGCERGRKGRMNNKTAIKTAMKNWHGKGREASPCPCRRCRQASPCSQQLLKLLHEEVAQQPLPNVAGVQIVRHKRRVDPLLRHASVEPVVRVQHRHHDRGRHCLPHVRRRARDHRTQRRVVALPRRGARKPRVSGVHGVGEHDLRPALGTAACRRRRRRRRPPHHCHGEGRKPPLRRLRVAGGAEAQRTAQHHHACVALDARRVQHLCCERRLLRLACRSHVADPVVQHLHTEAAGDGAGQSAAAAGSRRPLHDVAAVPQHGARSVEGRWVRGHGAAAAGVHTDRQTRNLVESRQVEQVALERSGKVALQGEHRRLAGSGCSRRVPGAYEAVHLVCGVEGIQVQVVRDHGAGRHRLRQVRCQRQVHPHFRRVARERHRQPGAGPSRGVRIRRDTPLHAGRHPAVPTGTARKRLAPQAQRCRIRPVEVGYGVGGGIRSSVGSLCCKGRLVNRRVLRGGSRAGVVRRRHQHRQRSGRREGGRVGVLGGGGRGRGGGRGGRENVLLEEGREDAGHGDLAVVRGVDAAGRGAVVGVAVLEQVGALDVVQAGDAHGTDQRLVRSPQRAAAAILRVARHGRKPVRACVNALDENDGDVGGQGTPQLLHKGNCALRDHGRVHVPQAVHDKGARRPRDAYQPLCHVHLHQAVS
eukprot:Rhum_TRINITY_DN14806_c17_g1::Rhum_TRINITY_DN14806_c17_g1_i1::g.120195::m.120195